MSDLSVYKFDNYFQEQKSWALIMKEACGIIKNHKCCHYFGQ